MTSLDVAKLKRLRSAVAGALESVPEDSARGLPPTYNALRMQVIETLPDDLRPEAEAIAPAVREVNGAHSVIEASSAGKVAHAHLAALKGWIDAVIGAA